MSDTPDDPNDSFSQRQSDFVNVLRNSETPHSEGHYRAFTTLWHDMPDAADKIGFLKILWPALPAHGRLRFCVEDESLALGNQLRRDNHFGQATEAYTIAGELAETGSQIFETAAAQIKSLVSTGLVEPAQQLAAWRVVITKDQHPETVTSCTHAWIKTYQKLTDPETKLSVLTDTLDYPRRYSETLQAFLGQTLKQHLAQPTASDTASRGPPAPSPDGVPDDKTDALDTQLQLVHRMLHHVTPGTWQEADWCHHYHALSLRHAVNNTHGRFACDAVSAQLAGFTGLPYAMQMCDIYDNLSVIMPCWQDQTGAYKLPQQAARAKTQRMNKAKQHAAKTKDEKLLQLQRCAKQALAASGETGEAYNAALMADIVTHWGQRSTRRIKHSVGNFYKNLDEKIRVTGQFIDRESQAPAVAAYMENKQSLYRLIKHHTSFDTTAQDDPVHNFVHAPGYDPQNTANTSRLRAEIIRQAQQTHHLSLFN